ncbi:MAG: PadR family transcriptional regulator [Vicinamibacterales bacterium]
MRKTLHADAGLAGPAQHIMLALGTDTMHGYAIMQSIVDRSGGEIRILPGTLYSTLKKLLAEGLVEECDPPKNTDSEDARRRYYGVTKAGKVAMKTQTERLALLVRLGRVFS